MTKTIMTKNVLYAVMMVSSFGVYSVSLAMNKKSVVTREEDNYLSSAKQNLEKAEEVGQANLTVIKRDIKKTEKKLQVQPMNLDQDVFPVVENDIKTPTTFGLPSNGPRRNPLVFKKLSDTTQEQVKKEQSEKAKQEKNAENDRLQALELAAYLQEKNAYFASFDDVQLVEEVDKKPSVRKVKNKTPRNRTNAQPPVVVDDSFVKPDLGFSSPMMPTPRDSGIDGRGLRSRQGWTPSATRNLNDAIAGNMENTTVLKSMIRQNEKAKAKKAIALNLDSSSSSEDKS